MTDKLSSGELIAGSRVMDTEVFDTAGERIGKIDDLIIHKITGQVSYALMSFGGFLGIGEKLHPLPWEVLSYDTGKDGYIVPVDKEVLKNAPSLDPDNIDELAAGTVWRSQLHEYYGSYGARPYP